MTYILILTANNGEQARLTFDNLEETQRMKTAFMLTGDYSHADIEQIFDLFDVEDSAR